MSTVRYDFDAGVNPRRHWNAPPRGSGGHDEYPVVAPDRRNVLRDGKSSVRRVNFIRYVADAMTIQLPLQPLRIPPGWRVTYNIFFEVDPSPETMEWFNESMMLGIASDDGRYFIDMAFTPENGQNGFFYVQFLRSDSPSRSESRQNWQSIGGDKTSSRAKAVEQIEKFMHQVWQQGTSDEVR